MRLEHTWSAVLRPGCADRYFSAFGDRLFNPASGSYDALTAWWMAELCRLIYRRDRARASSRSKPGRQTFLAQVGLSEQLFVSIQGAECAIVGPGANVMVDFQVVVFRGANALRDWLHFVFNVGPSPWSAGGLVHRGFRKAFDLVWPRVEHRLRPGVPTFYTGHSMGGALTVFAAATRQPTAAYTFGAPIVGDDTFAATLAGSPLYRIVNVGDLATRVGRRPLGHVGQFRYVSDSGLMISGPSPDVVALDRRTRPIIVPGRPLHTYVIGPPRMGADHAPVNYVARLEQLARYAQLASGAVLPSPSGSLQVSTPTVKAAL